MTAAANRNAPWLHGPRPFLHRWVLFEFYFWSWRRYGVGGGGGGVENELEEHLESADLHEVKSC